MIVKKFINDRTKMANIINYAVDKYKLDKDHLVAIQKGLELSTLGVTKFGCNCSKALATARTALVKKGTKLLTANNKSSKLTKKGLYYLHGNSKNKSLGVNPFYGKNFKQIDKVLRKREFNIIGKDPINGKGAYFHSKTERKYYLDKGREYGKKIEHKHVDVHRMHSGKNLQKKLTTTNDFQFKDVKRKYPLGDKLNELKCKK